VLYMLCCAVAVSKMCVHAILLKVGGSFVFVVLFTLSGNYTGAACALFL